MQTLRILVDKKRLSEFIQAISNDEFEINKHIWMTARDKTAGLLIRTTGHINDLLETLESLEEVVRYNYGGLDIKTATHIFNVNIDWFIPSNETEFSKL